MEYHYQDLCAPADHYSNEHYAPDYSQSYMHQNQDAEYEVRSTVLVDGGDRFGVSAVCFDKYEELVWMGNQGGHVTSYYGPNMQKYTSFQVHESEEIRDLCTFDAGILALSKTSLRHQIRRGLPRFTYRSQSMKDMQCLYQVNNEKLIMGGHQSTIIDFDVTTKKECVISIAEDSCVVLASGGGSLVACGSASGFVALRDLRCPGAAARAARAHSAALSDLDMQGNLLVSCGFTDNPSGVAQPEPFVVVWDVRRLRAGSPAGCFPAPTGCVPRLLHFLPAISGRVAAAAGSGQVALLQLNSPGDTASQSVFQVDTQNTACLVMDVAASSQGLVFGDQSGHLHLFSPQHNHEPIFNSFSRETEFADPPPTNLPFVSFRDETFQFSSVPLPALVTGDRWLNELPPEFYKKVYRKPKPINPEVLKTMKMQGPIGYAPNPGTNRRNQIPYVPDTLADVKAKQNEMRIVSQPVPRQYQKLDLRYNKHAPNEDLDNCNKTGFPGLEATLPNAYCNAMLQVLYNTKAVKSILLAHSCAKEFCLSCELGFLFRTLDASNGAPCQAGNFLRAFRTVPEAAALGLILPERGPADPRLDFVALIQNWNRFLLHQMHSEIVETRKKEKELSVLTSASSPTNTKKSLTPTLNGSFDAYNDYSLEFLGPTEFDSPDEKENGEWNVNEDGSVLEPPGSCSSIEMPSTVGSEDSDISDLFAIGRHQLNRCLKCNKEEERESVVLACALQYPPPAPKPASGRPAPPAPDAPAAPAAPAAPRAAQPGFVELLLGALCSRRSTPAWCERCRRFSPTLQRGRAVRLPPVLSINCGGVTAHEKAYWSKGVQKEMAEGVKRGGIQKPCRYGQHCARPGCRFKHPERPGASFLGPRGADGGASPCVLPRRLSVALGADGEVTVNDKTEPPPEHHYKDSPSKQNRRKFPPAREQYALAAAVVCVEDNPKNLVAYVKMDAAAAGRAPGWHLFNDLSIVPVSEDEVIHFGPWWKTPCVVLYSRADTPGQPGQSSPLGQPGQSGQLSQPGQTGQLSQPGQSGQLGQPSQSGQLGQPSQSGQPGKPGQSGQPGKPGQSGQPDKPGQSSQFGQPGQSGQLGQPSQSGQLGQAGQSGQPGQSGQLSQPGQSSQFGQPGQSGQPGQPGQSGQLGQPGQSGPPGQSGQPCQPGQPGQSCQLSQPGQRGQRGQFSQAGHSSQVGSPKRS